MKSIDLISVDIAGDGNCYFRSLPVCLYGSQDHHLQLRNDIIQYMMNSTGEAGSKQIRRQLENMKKPGEWVGEAVVQATACYLKRAVHVFAAVGNSLLIYEPGEGCAEFTALRGGTGDPLRVAFMEPGHYKAVIKRNVLPTITCCVNLPTGVLNFLRPPSQ